MRGEELETVSLEVSRIFAGKGSKERGGNWW